MRQESDTINNNCKVVIPDGVTEIREREFAGRKDITSIIIPRSVTKIGFGAFYDCSGITSIEIPNSVTEIGDSVFSGCKGLSSIEIPDSVTKIGNHAFSGCECLSSIEIPNSIQEIGKCAFTSCMGLKSIEIPNSVKKIGDAAFSWCVHLCSISVATDNGSFCSVDNCLLTIDRKTLLVGCKESIIPNSVTEIGYSAFRGCWELTSIEIPNSVTKIGDCAFSRCLGLKSIEIPNSVTEIGCLAFEFCQELKSVEIPNSVTEIGNAAFAFCKGLSSIEIPSSVMKIGISAFSGCEQLSSISVTTNNKYFCSINNCLLTIDRKTLLVGCKESIIPYSVTEIGDRAFEECWGLTSIEIPNNVTKIGICAFSHCLGLTSISIPKSVSYIAKWAFWNCSNLSSIIILNNEILIGDDAFMDCDNLQALYITIEDPFLTEIKLLGSGLSYEHISLYVPVGTGYAYRHNDYCKQFKEIIATNKWQPEISDNTINESTTILKSRIDSVLDKDSGTEAPRQIEDAVDSETEYVFFDTETTGLPEDYSAPSSALENWPRLIQLSWITVDFKGTIIKQNDRIIYPDGFVIPASSSQVHGITTEIARKNGVSLQEALAAFMNDVENAKWLVGHNVSFDIKVVGAELIRLGKKDTIASKPSICTMQSSIDFCAIPGYYGYKYPKLQELHKKLFGYEFEDAHNALSDIRATLKCYLELKRRGIILS